MGASAEYANEALKQWRLTPQRHVRTELSLSGVAADHRRSRSRRRQRADGRGEGNPYTIDSPNFLPPGAPASNLTGPNFTLPFPSSPSGHAGFGAPCSGPAAVPWSERYRLYFRFGRVQRVTRDNTGQVRPLEPRTFVVTLASGRRERPQPDLPWASTGPSRRVKASRKGGRLPTTCSTTHLRP